MKILRKKIHDVYPGLEVTDFTRIKSGSDIYAYEGPCTCSCSCTCGECECHGNDVLRYGIDYGLEDTIHDNNYDYPYDATFHGYG